MKNKVQLITYVDRFGKKGIAELHSFLKNKLPGVFEGGVHLLPFFNSIDGADAGYDPIDHTAVDARIGTWEDIRKFSMDFDIMADIIVNHMSADSIEFQDVKLNGRDSKYFDLFLTKDKVFHGAAVEVDLKKIYRPRPNDPFTLVEIGSGIKETFWTTFTSNQIDIDVNNEHGIAYLNNILDAFQANGIKCIRLDAAGYAIKKAGTSCFMIPESYVFIDDFTQKAKQMGMEVLVEIHTHYQQQIEIAQKVDYVYDFALPPLVLFAMASGSGRPLKEWLTISPKNCLTVLDTHDGIGIMDVAKKDNKMGLLNDSEIDFLVESIHKNSNEESRKVSGGGGSNLDIYQVNCSFFEALGRNANDYLIARAIQFFCPGIPQVYYGGFLAARNDIELFEKTNVGRDINRPYLSFDDISEMMKKGIVQNLCQLIKFRNEHRSFNGDFSIQDTTNEQLVIIWKNGSDWSQLLVDFEQKSMIIRYGNENGEELMNFDHS